MKRIIILFVIVVIVVCGGIFFVYQSAQPQKPAVTPVTKSSVTHLLADSYDILRSSNNQPIFTVTSLVHPSKSWYVVSITAQNTSSPVAKFIIEAPQGIESARIIDDRKSSFSATELDYDNVPDAVKRVIME